MSACPTNDAISWPVAASQTSPLKADPVARRVLAPETDRSAFLATVAAQWAQLDPAEYPFARQVATQLPEHDDREQFLAGIDLILAGITTVR
jgi:predicted Zn-dependent protease